MLTRPSQVVTVTVGYGDGLHRTLGNVGEVLLRGRRCPIVGRVSMDQIQIDATDVPGVVPGDVATLLGRDGEEEITAAQMAAWAQTTCHAPTTMLTRRVARRYA
jgi:alanine racemase